MLGHHIIHARHVLQTESGSQHRDLHLLLQRGIRGQSELRLHIVTELTHEFMHFVHLFHGQLVALFLITERNAQQHLLGVEYVVVIEQRRMKRTFDSLAHTSFTLSESSTHDGHTTVFQHRGHILEVEVYNTMYRNNFGYALGGHGQRIVCLGKGIQHRKLRINLAQAFIIDNQQRIDMLGYFLHPV